MQFISLYTPDTLGSPSPQHMEDMGRLMNEQLLSGALVVTGGLGQRAATGVRVTFRNGAFTVEEAPVDASVLLGASGFAIANAASKEAYIEGLKTFMQAAGAGVCEAVALAFPPMVGPEPMMPRGVVPYLSVVGGLDAIAFYKRAFAAQEAGVMMAEDGKRVMHAQLVINGGVLMLSDAFPEYGQAHQPSHSYTMQLVLPDGQSWWDRAIAAGCTEKMPFVLAPWGDRYGQMLDPFGVTWAINQPAAAG